MSAAVVLTSQRSRSLVLAAVVVAALSLLAGLVVALRGDRVWSVWGVLGLLALLGGLVLVLLVPRLVPPITATISPAGYRRTRRGEVEVDLPRAELTRVVFHPAEHRIVLHSLTASVELDEGVRWREVVAIVRDWVGANPSLVADDATRELLLTDTSVHRSLPGLLWRWVVPMRILLPVVLVLLLLVVAVVVAVVGGRSLIESVSDAHEPLQRSPVGQVVVHDELA